MPPSPSHFVEIMTPALIEAAKLARKLEGRVSNQPKQGERTAVKQALTEADTASQEVLLRALLRDFPDVALAAEEETPTTQHFPDESSSLVIIDPVDGTLRSFLEGAGPYSTIVGLAVERRMKAGLVAVPRAGLLCSAAEGAGATLTRSGDKPRPARLSVEGRRVLVSHGMPDEVAKYLCAQGYDPLPASGGAVSVAPLLPGVVGGVRYARGEGGVSIRGRVGALISREAGAALEGDRRESFPNDLDTPSATLRVAAEARHLDVFQAALEAAGLGTD